MNGELRESDAPSGADAVEPLLRDRRDADDPTVAFAAQLLSTVRVEEPGPLARRRVRAAIADRATRPAWSWSWSLLLRPAVVALLLFGLVAAAGATLVRRWLDHAAPVVDSVALTAQPSSTRTSAPPPIAPSLAPSLPAAVPSATPSLPAVPFVPLVPLVNDPALGRAMDSSATDPEVSLVVDAVNALRRDHRPDRAATLLATYRQRYPRGVLAEEALVLAIEAAMHGRADDAAALGAEYLARYPTGRFVAVARSAGTLKQP